MTTTITRHANLRSVQRTIPPHVIDLILDYGEVRRSRGADSYSLTKRGRLRLRSSIGPQDYRQLQPLLNAYVVLSDEGTVITVARRLRRRRNP